MAAAAQDVFEEHLGVIAALKDNYTRRDDAQTVANINNLKDEVAQLCSLREDQVRDAIKELTRRVATAEEEARYPGPEDAHAQRAAQLEKATAGARSGVEELTAQLRALEAQREEVKAELAQLELQQKELEKVKGEVEPALRHRHTLYVSSTMVEWDLKSMDRLAGTIANPDSKHYGKFDLGPAGDAATYDQVNALWAMIQN